MGKNNSWLKREIAQGFVMLAALNLKGRPASADLTAVAELWLGILGGRSWQLEHKRQLTPEEKARGRENLKKLYQKIAEIFERKKQW